ncbi:MAG TPA: tetratricopeptide repeat protein [Pirellulales bacterium]|nr:tetratricopeptide repeat protein [Pirellulales bacterium]
MRLVLCLSTWLCLSTAGLSAAIGELPTTGFRAVDYEPALRSRNRPAARWTDLRCTILKQEGDWLWIHSFDGKEGWLRNGEVVPLDRAEQFFTQKIAADPNNTFWYQSRANVRQELGDLDTALDDLGEAIRRQPENHYLLNNRATVYEAQKKYEEAIADYNAALKLSPNDPVYWANAAATRLRMKDYGKAVANADRAIALDAQFPVAYRIRAIALAFQGNGQRALDDFTQAARLDPSGPSSYASPAWTQATCPVDACRNGKKAVELATHACELTGWKDSWCLDVLGAAYAEAGDFANATKYAKKAEELASAVDKPEISKRLELYGTKQPYRDE